MPYAAISQGDWRKDVVIENEIKDLLVAMSFSGFDNKYALLKFVYSDIYDRLFFILGTNDSISIGQISEEDGLRLDKKSLQDIFLLYKDRFLELLNTGEGNIVSKGKEYFDIWQRLYKVFVEPLIGIRKGLPYKEVLYEFSFLANNEYVALNLGLIYDLSFRFGNILINEPLYFTHVSEKSFFLYLQDVQKLPFPVINKMVMLFGLKRMTEREISELPILPNNKAKLKFRQDILEKMIKLFESQEGLFVQLQSIEDFDHFIDINSKQSIIQLITHFHDNFIHTIDDYIELDDLLSLLRNKKANKSLRDDLIMDAVTCNNHDSFLKLQKAGVKYVHYSNQIIDTSFALLMLLELYGGQSAKANGWQFPYLDGKTHLHVAYSNVLRSYFVQMNKENSIKL